MVQGTSHGRQPDFCNSVGPHVAVQWMGKILGPLESYNMAIPGVQSI